MKQSLGNSDRGTRLRAGDVKRREFLKGAGLLAGSALLGTSLIAESAEPVPGAVVETVYGKIRGLRQNGIDVFKGVRYGASTAGANRFMPPVKPAAWTGVIDTFRFGHQCPQNVKHTEVLAPQAPASEGYSEDCLFLNVWTPATNDGRKRPVMFWCHGGGFTWESGSWPWIDGTALARRGDVVVVTVNHRLGLFGYLSLKEFGAEKYAASGNVGMLDLVAALQWVRDNIERFGGDPGNVTIFGESGGGAKVSTLLAMPAAKGLFHRAAIQSGPWLIATPQSEATAVAQSFLDELHVTRREIDRMQQFTVEQLLSIKAGDMTPAAPGRGRLRMGMAPVVDGRILPTNPFDPVAPAVSADVPLLVGCTRQETSLFYLNDEAVFTLDEKGLRERVGVFLDPADVTEVIETYRRENPDMGPGDLFLLITTDRLVRRDAILMAERKHALASAPVYMYYFAWQSPALGGKLRAPHTIEIPFVFDNTDIPTVMTRSPKAAALGALTSSAWIAFARNGNPTQASLKWDAYDPRRRATMVFDNVTRLVDDPAGRARDFWSQREP
jgi:para-nitrobenzyl esterase